jgi:hypothetical protein
LAETIEREFGEVLELVEFLYNSFKSRVGVFDYMWYTFKKFEQVGKPKIMGALLEVA